MSSSPKKSFTKAFIAGSLSGTCSTLLFQPLDLVKTRIQNPIAVMNGSTSMANVIVTVVRHDSVIGLWKGITPSIVRCVPGVGLYFGSMHMLTSKFCPTPSPIESMCVGVAARSFVATLMLPITVVKTRFECGQFAYRSVLDALRQILVQEGARGLFSGLGATLLRDAPFSGIYLMFYNQLKQHSDTALPEQLRGPTTHFCCGLVAGTLAATVTQPADVIKTSMQIDSNKFRSVTHAVLFTYQTRGVSGFFRGLAPRTCRRTLMAALAWTLYEQALQGLNLK